MKLYILRPRVKLIFWLPTALLSWKLLWRKLLSSQSKLEKEEILRLLPSILKGLKLYKRKKGHFHLLEVMSSNVKIIIKV